MWGIIQQNNGMDGINLKPAPRPNANGSYTIKLTPAQWAKFQENQARPPVPQQASPAAGAAAPAGNDAPSGDNENISVSQDPSMLSKSYSLRLQNKWFKATFRIFKHLSLHARLLQSIDRRIVVL